MAFMFLLPLSDNSSLQPHWFVPILEPSHLLFPILEYPYLRSSNELRLTSKPVLNYYLINGLLHYPILNKLPISLSLLTLFLSMKNVNKEMLLSDLSSVARNVSSIKEVTLSFQLLYSQCLKRI